MINFAKLFDAAIKEIDNQKKIPITSALEVFYGISTEGHLRLSFVSRSKAPKLESTKVLKVSQGAENPNVYWTCFDLLQQEASSVYFAFCENIVMAITNIENETVALDLLKKRFITWKTMFKQLQETDVSIAIIQGLFGELYFLKNYMLLHYTAKDAISAWAGAEFKSKDYSIGEKWFEVKTVGANANSVRISSLSQLDSATVGHLVIVKIEAMSDEFNGEDVSINALFNDISIKICDELTEEIFLNKIKNVVGQLTNKVLNTKFNVKSMAFYLIDEHFPRLQNSNIPFSEITDVEYSLDINMLEKYMEINQ